MPDNVQKDITEGRSEPWDHSSHGSFVEYYANESLSEETRARFTNLRDIVLRTAERRNLLPGTLEVGDVGCGAGTLSRLWAECGHKVHSVDISADLIAIATERAVHEGHDIDFRVGSATALPWPDQSMDVCLVPELLEHVVEWQTCLDEFARVLKPGGILYLSTDNKLCPIQQEFNLPLYSWYPPFLKRHFEKLAVSSRPELVNYATYPAINWFSPYQLSRVLARLGLDSMDRFDLMGTHSASPIRRFVVNLVRHVPPLRFMAHVATPYTVLIAIKRSS